MSRPTKQGIDYFPMDNNPDKKLKLFILKNGAEGFGILVLAWGMIYREEGYYTRYDEDFVLLLREESLSEAETIVSVIKNAINRGLFDRELFEKYQILTSQGIQKRYFQAAKKKKEVAVISEYLLIDVSDCDNLVYVAGNEIDSGGNALKEEGKGEVEVDVEIKEKEKPASLGVSTPSQKAKKTRMANLAFAEVVRNKYIRCAAKYVFGKLDIKCTPDKIPRGFAPKFAGMSLMDNTRFTRNVKKAAQGMLDPVELLDAAEIYFTENFGKDNPDPIFIKQIDNFYGSREGIYGSYMPQWKIDIDLPDVWVCPCGGDVYVWRDIRAPYTIARCEKCLKRYTVAEVKELKKAETVDVAGLVKKVTESMGKAAHEGEEKEDRNE